MHIHGCPLLLLLLLLLEQAKGPHWIAGTILKTHQLPTLTREGTRSGSYNLGGCPPLNAITTVKSVKHEGMQVQIHTPGVNQHVGVAQVYRAITSNHV